MADNDKPPIMVPWINSPRLRRAELWLWNRPKVAIAVTVFSIALVTSPAWFSDVWGLFSSNAPIPTIMNWNWRLPVIHFSWYWVPVALGITMFLVVASLLWRGLRRVQAQGVTENLAPSEAPKCLYEWTHEIANRQGRTIRDFVSISRIGVWKPRSGSTGVPTIKWGFMLKNNSLFPITLIDVDRNLIFEGTELAERRFEIENEIQGLRPGAEGNVIFEQRLSGPEYQLIKNLPKGKFRFHRLLIKVGSQDSFPAVEPQVLAIGNEFETSLDEIVYKETEGMKSLKDEIASLKQQVEALTPRAAKEGLSDMMKTNNS